ncbi:blast:Sodium/potassium/calcium exchanger 6%2C mitochondrial [Drosophila guanche]|uniref:Blast:Sodium/potassium/calcium exchanger 6, mitochondrial n=2 Tax=Drosophila guanche TaxID=7266 RepID=A0A3B0JNT7_DROGU|nr:blast:Sodium/potassium/calcium exchanger 6%2C mitochondrial [Drosophila guanche]
MHTENDDNKTFYAMNYHEMSCFGIMDVDYEDRCMLADKLAECDVLSTMVHYFTLLYCDLNIRSKLTELCALFIMLLVIFALMVTISIIVESHFSPMLKIISMKMGLSEYVAGSMLLAIGNSMPDALANMLPVRSEAPMYSISISNSLAIVLVAGGMVCYLKPFKMNPHNTLRDLLILMLACETLTFVLLRHERLYARDGIYLICGYCVYVLVNISDLIVVRKTIKSLRAQISEAILSPESEERNAQIGRMRYTLNELEKDHQLSIHRHRGRRRSSSWRFHSDSEIPHSARRFSYGFTTPRPKPTTPEVDFEATRTILHSNQNSRNLFLFADFWETVLPLDLEKWAFSGCCTRFLMILKAPLEFFCTIFLPMVDYEKDKHGWSKLLNCIQIVTCPVFMIMLLESIIVNKFTGWFIEMQFTYATWSLCITVPLAVFTFINSRTDLPPPYHLLFLGLNAAGSLLIMAIFAAELEFLCCIGGLILYLSEPFVAVTFRSLAGSISDMIVAVSLAMEGYEQMALGAILGAPIFNIMSGMGLAILFQKTVRHGPTFFLFGKLGENCYIFFYLAILSTLWWTLTFNFFARRSAGVFSFILYAVFIMYSALVEWHVVHEFSKDSYIAPK